MAFIPITESDIQAWFHEHPGKLLLSHQQTLVKQYTSTLSSKQPFILEAGLSQQLDLSSTHPGCIKQKLSLSDLLTNELNQAEHFKPACLDQLKPRTMQLTLVHHLLDFCGNARERIIHDLLRVTEYGGTLCIIGLNPLGLWPNWIQWKKQTFWHKAQAISAYQLAKHLADQGCIHITYSYQFVFFPYEITGCFSTPDILLPLQQKLQKLCFLSCYYMLSAIVSKPNRMLEPDVNLVMPYLKKTSLDLNPVSNLSPKLTKYKNQT